MLVKGAGIDAKRLHSPGKALLRRHCLTARLAEGFACSWRAGCPNGCARPYMAELGFVGDGPNSYQLWLGGTPNQTRLAEAYQDRVKLQVRCCELLSPAHPALTLQALLMARGVARAWRSAKPVRLGTRAPVTQEG